MEGTQRPTRPSDGRSRRTVSTQLLSRGNAGVGDGRNARTDDRSPNERLWELVEAGVELDPIFITRDGKVVDGRHRIEAHTAAKKTEIRAKIVEADSDVELVAFALKCNMGGSLPPSKEDFEHVIRELLNRGVPKKQLAEIA